MYDDNNNIVQYVIVVMVVLWEGDEHVCLSLANSEIVCDSELLESLLPFSVEVVYGLLRDLLCCQGNALE